MIEEYEEATRTMAGYEPQQETIQTHKSINFSFSLQIISHEGLSLKGDMSMQKNATGPTKIQRASRPVQQSVIEEQEYIYDDDSVGKMPRSALRYRSTQQQSERVTRQLPQAKHRVSGSTRLGLYGVLLFCVMFLLNGIVAPMFVGMFDQWKYGNDRIAAYDLDNHHFITEDDNGRIRIVVSNEDGTHSQLLTTVISGAPDHALVTLSQDGTKIDVSVNGAFLTTIVSGSAGYQWGN